MASIVDKYLNKKKKELYEYSKEVNNLLEYNKSQIWSNDSEFNSLVKSTIDKYVDSYYFKPMTEFDGYSDYFGALVKCDNRFKTVLVCAIDSVIDEKNKEDNKVSYYIVSLIVYTAIALNRFTYPYNNYKIIITNVFTIIDAMFKNIDFMRYKDSSKLRKELTASIKGNALSESRFFESLNALNNDVSGNMYETVDFEGKYYTVKYKYKIPELNNYRQRDVDKYFKRISDDLNSLSYELATITILKSKMLNKDITLLFPADLEFYRKESEINKLSKVISNEGIKNSVKLLVEYDDYVKNKEVIRILANAGFEMALNFDNAADVPYRTFNEIKTAIVNMDFINKNKGNMESWKASGVNFVIKSDVRNELSELRILGLEEK